MSTPIKRTLTQFNPFGELTAQTGRSRRPPNIRTRERLDHLLEASFGRYDLADQLSDLYGFLSGRKPLTEAVAFKVLKTRHGVAELRGQDLGRLANEEHWEWQIHAYQQILLGDLEYPRGKAAASIALFRDWEVSFNDGSFESSVLKVMLAHLKLPQDQPGAKMLERALATGDDAALRGVVAALLVFARSGMSSAPIEAALQIQLALLDPRRQPHSPLAKAWSISLKRITAELEREQHGLLEGVPSCAPEMLEQERKDLQRERQVLLKTSQALVRAHLPVPMRELLNKAGNLPPQELAKALTELYKPDIEGMVGLLKDRASVIDALQLLWGGHPSTALRFAQAVGDAVVVSPSAAAVLNAVEDALLDRLDLTGQERQRYFNEWDRYPEGDEVLLRFMMNELDRIATSPALDKEGEPILVVPAKEPRFAGLRAWIAEWAKANAPLPVASSHPAKPPHG